MNRNIILILSTLLAVSSLLGCKNEERNEPDVDIFQGG